MVLGNSAVTTRESGWSSIPARGCSNIKALEYWVARSSPAMTALLMLTASLVATVEVAERYCRSMLRHHAPFGDHGFAHLPGVLRAGDFVDLHRDFLANVALQLRRLRIIAGDDLECFWPGFQTAKPVRRRQPARLADELIGVDALALGAAAHGIELPGQNIGVFDRLLCLLCLLRLHVGRAGHKHRQSRRSQRGSFTKIVSRHVSSDSSFQNNVRCRIAADSVPSSR